MSARISPTPDNPSALTLAVSALSINSALAANWTYPQVSGGTLQAPTLTFGASNGVNVSASVLSSAGQSAPLSFTGQLTSVRCAFADLASSSPSLAALAGSVYGGAAPMMQYGIVGVSIAGLSAELRTALLGFKGDLLPIALMGLQPGGGALALANPSVAVVVDAEDSRATNIVFYGNLGTDSHALKVQSRPLLDASWLDGGVAMVAGRAFVPTQALVSAALKPALDKLLGVSGVAAADGLAYSFASSTQHTMPGVVSGSSLLVEQSWNLRIQADPGAETFTVSGGIQASASSEAKALFNLATVGITRYAASAPISGKLRVILQDAGLPTLSFVGPTNPIGAATTQSTDSGINEAGWAKALATYGFGAGTPDKVLSSLSDNAEAKLTQALGAALNALNTPVPGLRVVPPGAGLFAMSDPVFCTPADFCSINLNFLAM